MALAALLLGVLLLASLAGNAWLLRKVWTAQAECRAGMAQAARIAIEAEQARAGSAEQQAVAIAGRVAQATASSIDDSQRSTHVRAKQLGRVPVTGDCRVPAGGLPSIQPAIDEANAAAGD